MTAFRPANGVRARWRYLYELVASSKVNDGITYEQVQLLLDCNREVAQAAMREAIAHLEKDGEQSVRTAANFGWVVMRPAEHIRESQHHLRKARNQARRALRKVSAIDNRRDELTQAERQDADLARLAASMTESLTGRRRKSFGQLFTPTAPVPISPDRN